MSTSVENKEILAVDVRMESERFYVILNDGREIGVPYSWFWRLERATPKQRENWEFIGLGSGIHWPEPDEDISIKGILAGKRSAEKPPEAATHETQ